MSPNLPFFRSPRVFAWVDLLVLGGLLGFVYGVVAVADEWTAPLRVVAEIHTEARYLPLYALYSLARGICAYGISLGFTLVYGYAMARLRGGEMVLVPLLDILQSIPVLGFLPGFVLGLVHLFPHRNLGLEMASVLMIFTGQAWNMTFSFYASLKSTPPDLWAVTRLSKMSWWRRFTTLELSHAAPGLVWNSMMSMAGGWFFLTVSEAFVLGDHDFRLPGLGSFMSVAIERGDTRSQVLGVVAMLGMIVFFDQVVWRPIVAWAQKFNTDESGPVAHSWIWERVRRSWTWNALVRMWIRVGVWVRVVLRGWSATRSAGGAWGVGWAGAFRVLLWMVGVGLVLGALMGLARYLQLLGTLRGEEWMYLGRSTLATFLRVFGAVALATLWAVPVGVWIGRHPVWARRLQPVIQMAASFPAPMIFPLVVGWLAHVGMSLGGSAVVLLMMGTQWYVLFNVMAGVGSIPKELWEVTRLGRFSAWERWTKLILPGLFPSLLTGWVTAAGGAWNASIVAEYMKVNGAVLTTTGLGSAISKSTEHGDFPVLAGAIGIMALTVVCLNRLVWRRLGHYAQSRFAMSS